MYIYIYIICISTHTYTYVYVEPTKNHHSVNQVLVLLCVCCYGYYPNNIIYLLLVSGNSHYFPLDFSWLFSTVEQMPCRVNLLAQFRLAAYINTVSLRHG